VGFFDRTDELLELAFVLSINTNWDSSCNPLLRRSAISARRDRLQTARPSMSADLRWRDLLECLCRQGLAHEQQLVPQSPTRVAAISGARGGTLCRTVFLPGADEEQSAWDSVAASLHPIRYGFRRRALPMLAAKVPHWTDAVALPRP